MDFDLTPLPGLLDQASWIVDAERRKVFDRMLRIAGDERFITQHLNCVNEALSCVLVRACRQSDHSSNAGRD